MEGTPMHPPVLIVDGYLALRTIMSAILTEEGYHVLTAEHGGIGLDIMRASPEPMVVTLDLTMPEVSGIAVLEAVATDPVSLQRHAIILMTANVALATSGRVKELRDQMVIPLVGKPFTEHGAGSRCGFSPSGGMRRCARAATPRLVADSTIPAWPHATSPPPHCHLQPSPAT
jgi:CheY-like chemotaxis protein